jgi:hypothetical protein
LLSFHRFEDVELFPKQDEPTGGPGSLIRMPFGVHRLTGGRGPGAGGLGLGGRGDSSTSCSSLWFGALRSE